VAKKHRMRSRPRRSVEAGRRASSVRPQLVERETARPAPSRLRYGSRSGTARAIGAPSASLERAAALERSFVLKDFRRIALVVAIALALLVASGLILSVAER
jgi:hypothetical protein